MYYSRGYECRPADMCTVTWETGPPKTPVGKAESRLELLLIQPVSTFGLIFMSWTDAKADGMIKVIDSATRESCGGKQMRL
jgi:hypothetical protein